EFLHQIKEICKKYKLFDSATGFNTKIIIADASIVNKDVIIQHLGNQNAEPDKIYFRAIKNQDIAPVSIENFEFFKQPATVINTNSYPAKSLKLNYKIIVESVKFDENAELKQKNRLIENVQNEIFKDLEKLLKNPDINQVIVYIQDKKRLAELIEGIKKKNNQFEKNKDYLEVHANISRTEKKEINKYKDQVKVIFMTASGSRGLSFPKAKHILVEIPRFSIEKNLMEIIQVIYRGRGDNDIDKQDKELFFYLADQAIYYKEDEGDKELELNESKLSLLNILLLLKAAILTRIAGKAQIGINDFLIIPIGGKSIYSVGEGFSSNMTNLINQLKSEYRSRPGDIILQDVYENLQHLLGMGHYQLTGNSTEKNQEESYLVLRETLADQFPEMCITLDKLLDFPKSEAGYIVGNLLLVNTKNNKLMESYEMTANKHIEKYATETVLKKMYVISNSNQYPDSLKSLIKDGIELIKKLRENLEITQTFKQELQQMDQYYAIPLFAFIAGETMANYFTKMRDRVGYSPQENEEEVSQFRDILSVYIRTIYPVQNILPIGSDYAEFPFVLFRSYNLEEIRHRMFTDKYLLNSTELNVINMILAQ
ncbi:MAG TPA: helicase-related protein, partial [Allocoleopsis sp.]